MTRLRIVTINTGKGDGPYQHRIGWLAEELGRLEPDIVLLQEALRTPDVRLDTTTRLATALGMSSAFVPARRKHRQVEGEWLDTWSGLGILSRSEGLQSETLVLPDHSDDGERVAQLGCWAIPGRDLVIANVHLTHLRDQDDLRSAQFATVLAHRWLNEVGAVTLIGGDLNTRPAHLHRFREVAVPRRLTDAYEVAGGAPDRITVPVGQPNRPGTCVDYLLAVSVDTSPTVTFSGAAIVLAQPDADGMYPSDHYGVMVDLHLPLSDERLTGDRPVD